MKTSKNFKRRMLSLVAVILCLTTLSTVTCFAKDAKYSKIAKEMSGGEFYQSDQAMWTGSTYVYSIKLSTKNNSLAQILRTKMSTGKTEILDATGSYSKGKAFENLIGHGNGMTGMSLCGKTNLFVTTSLKKSSSNKFDIVQLAVEDNKVKFVKGYKITYANSSDDNVSSIAVRKKDANSNGNGYIYLLFRIGTRFYEEKLQVKKGVIEQNNISFKDNSTKNGNYFTLNVFDNYPSSQYFAQDIGYGDGKVCVVLSGKSEAKKEKISAIKVFDYKTHKLLDTYKFNETSYENFEVESCSIRDGKLYFNVHAWKNGKRCDFIGKMNNF